MERSKCWAFVAVLVGSGAASADEGKCSFGGEKLADDCSALNWQKEGDFFDGCCGGKDVVWCENDGTALCGNTCPGESTCGWNEFGEYYGCEETATPDPSGANPLECPTTCEPSCSDKQCGYDGCAGFCGTCGDGTFCTEDGQCEACTCDGKTCGLDQCGESCGTCEGETFCKENQCEACSCDGKTCGSNECGTPCGTCTDGQGCDFENQCVDVGPGCKTSETPGCSGCADETCVCDADDFCCATAWDSYCVFQYEQCSNQECACVPNCEGQVCGGDGCGGECGKCDDGTACVANGSKCLACSCDNKACGTNACGEECGKCDEGTACSDNQCVPAMCAASADESKGCPGCACETCVCEADPFCCQTEWDNLCGQACGEKCGGECGECVPNCELQECGDDGCGGECGTCPEGQTCDFYDLCCTPQCDGKVCGADGCGGECGKCEAGFVCKANQCEVCKPSCDGAQCGPDGCGGECGTCPESQLCTFDGTCSPSYPDACLGFFEASSNTCPEGLGEGGCCDEKGRAIVCSGGQLYCEECGFEGDKGTCGWYADGGSYSCGESGADPSGENPLMCGGCAPACSGKECGPDGCGGSCGKCETDTTCNDIGRCVEDGAADATDATDGTEGADGTDGAVPDAGDGGPGSSDGTDATDGTSAADSTDGIITPGDGTDGAAASDSSDGGKTSSGDTGSGCDTSGGRSTGAVWVGLVAMALIARRRRTAA